jgi:hypothetical protein
MSCGHLEIISHFVVYWHESYFFSKLSSLLINIIIINSERKVSGCFLTSPQKNVKLCNSVIGLYSIYVQYLPQLNYVNIVRSSNLLKCQLYCSTIPTLLKTKKCSVSAIFTRLYLQNIYYTQNKLRNKDLVLTNFSSNYLCNTWCNIIHNINKLIN